MCYDISLHSDIELTKQAFPQLKDRRQNITPSDHEHTLAFGFPQYPIVSRQNSDLVLSEMAWSVDPTYEKDPVERKKRRIKMADIQSEHVLGDKRSYWYRLRNNRCLIPVSGTYEHRNIIGWPAKVPYYIWMKDRDIQYIPGLYQVIDTIGPGGERIAQASFRLLTRSANDLMRGIHNDGEFKHRMPLFLTEELEQFWLSEHFSEADMQAIFEYCLPSELLDYHPVFSVHGKKPRPDEKHKYERWHYENLPALGNDEPLQSQFSLF